jgi:prepilin-type N-terminal cleavage/methylation domain-containing protein
MNRRNGFTILELMVTMAVFAVVAAAAVALFQFQSKSSAGSNKRKLASEAVTLAMMTIQRDIERAGMGLMLQQPLSVMVVDGREKLIDPADKRPDELYLSFSDHVSMTLSRGDDIYRFFDLGSSPGLNKVWFPVGGLSYLEMANVGAWIGTDALQPPIGAIIRQTGTNKPEAVGLQRFDLTGTQTDKGLCTIRLTPRTSGGGNAAPAVSYTLIANQEDQDAYTGGRAPQLGTLMRNGIPQQSGGTPLIGAWQGEPMPSVKVTNFQVRCGFSRGTTCNFSAYYTDHSNVQCWTPDNGYSLGDTGYEIGNLRVIEVTINYIVLDKAAGAKYPSQITTEGFRLPSDNTPGPWALGGTQTITVAPRNLVLGQYLGPPK